MVILRYKIKLQWKRRKKHQFLLQNASKVTNFQERIYISNSPTHEIIDSNYKRVLLIFIEEIMKTVQGDDDFLRFLIHTRAVLGLIENLISMIKDQKHTKTTPGADDTDRRAFFISVLYTIRNRFMVAVATWYDYKRHFCFVLVSAPDDHSGTKLRVPM